MPAHYDFAFDYRTVSFDGPNVDSYSTFGRTFDLFGDGSVRLAFTPGHTYGHIAVICRLKERDLVIAGDAIYTLGQLGDAPPPPHPADPHTWRRSQQELKLFRRQYPQAVIIPGHDPEAWAALDDRYE
jgi:glyoxylase-like metal-dependent hydrolase (beta-lactamase superfamily II)